MGRGVARTALPFENLEKYWAASDQVEYARDINDDYDILFLNAIGTGPGRVDPSKTSLSYQEIRRLKTRGCASLWRAMTGNGRPKSIVMRTITIEKWWFLASMAQPQGSARDRGHEYRRPRDFSDCLHDAGVSRCRVPRRAVLRYS